VIPIPGAQATTHCSSTPTGNQRLHIMLSWLLCKTQLGEKGGILLVKRSTKKDERMDGRNEKRKVKAKKEGNCTDFSFFFFFFFPFFF
jgi:hypothetical protein